MEDAAFALNAIAGRDVLDCTSQDLDVDFTANLAEGVKGMRIGVVPAFMEAQGLTDEVKAKVEEAVEHLRALGADIVEVELPNAQAAMSAYYVLGPCEAFSNLARFDSVRYGYCDLGHKDLGGQYEASRAKGFGPEARRRIMLGSYLLSAGVYDTYYYPAQQVRTLITQDYARAYEQVDCIVAPVSPRTAFTFGEVSDPTDMYLSDMFTISINIAGNGGRGPCRWASAPRRSCPWACSSSRPSSRTRTCCAWPPRWKRCAAPPPWPRPSPRSAPTPKDRWRTSPTPPTRPQASTCRDC